jgi:hypothetical protein
MCLSNYAPAEAVFVLPSNLHDEGNYDVKVYPNPASDKVVVSSRDNIEQVKIYDVSGRLCFSDLDIKQEILIDISEFSKGLYTIHIINNIKPHISKLVIQ